MESRLGSSEEDMERQEAQRVHGSVVLDQEYVVSFPLTPTVLSSAGVGYGDADDSMNVRMKYEDSEGDHIELSIQAVFDGRSLPSQIPAHWS